MECRFRRTFLVVGKFRIFGLDVQTFTPTRDTTQWFIHPEDRPPVERILDKAVSEKSNFEVEFRLVLQDVSIRHVRSIGHHVVNDPAHVSILSGPSWT